LYLQRGSIENFLLQQFHQQLDPNGNLIVTNTNEKKNRKQQFFSFLPNLTRNGCLVIGLMTRFEFLTSSSASPAMISA